MKPQVYHVDAFTSVPFRGNSAGVVLHADGLSEAQMQLIARELRHSETAFLLTSNDSDVHIRYFTPTVEVPHLWTCYRRRALRAGQGTGSEQHDCLANLAGRAPSGGC